MNEIQNIIMSGKISSEAYYVLDGVYMKSKLLSGGRHIAKEVVGFKYMEIGGAGISDCYEIKRYSGDVRRLSRRLGTEERAEVNDHVSIDGTADILVVYETSELHDIEFVQTIEKLADEKTKIIYIMLKNDSNNKLLQYLVDKHLDQLMVITSAGVLRRQGMDVAFGLSWESTVSDLIWQVYADQTLQMVANRGKLIVRFSTEGALWFGNEIDNDTMTFQFVANAIEGDQFRSNMGLMLDIDAQFVMPIIDAIKSHKSIDQAIKKGLERAASYYHNGYKITKNGINYDHDMGEGLDIQSVSLTMDCMSQRPDYVWSLLVDDDRPALEELAKKVVIHGMKALADVPSAQFGHLVTVDRNEIERYRTIRNLLEEYLNTDKPARPLSIAVFGSPGSGKSFGVTQIAKCIGKDKISKMEFNLSQMQSQDELVEAFHEIQDHVLESKIPLVFFDEFDSDRDGVALGWLKSFLAPMQDGEFSHNGIHPIGKCIFIFAGGIYNTFDEFTKEQKNARAKVRDFISRLRGYVNIKGPNPNPSPEQDDAYILRRSVLLRSLIERKLNRINANNGVLRMDQDIVRAMLRVPQYRHGVRSMEAIIDMSMLAGKHCWDKADLPPVDQLAIHVDQDQFKHLLLVNKLLASYREEIAQAIHKNYLKSLDNQPRDRRKNNPNNCPWSELKEEFREDNRLQADDIVAKLSAIYCSIEPLNMSIKPFAFYEDEVEQLAKKEHDRWMENKRKNGWVYGKVKDADKKTSPYILPWEKLDEDARNLDRDPIRNIPDILKDANLGIYRIKP